MAVRGQERHRLGEHELLDDRADVGVRIAREQRARVGELVVATGDVGQLGDRAQLRVAPQVLGLEPVEDERAQPLVEPLRERRLPVPAPLVLGPLDQADVRVRLDQRDPPLDALGVVGRPVARAAR